MIDRDEVRTRVLRALLDRTSMDTDECDIAADHIITALYAPRTRLREVVAPSGAVVTFERGIFCIADTTGNFEALSAVDCAFKWSYSVSDKDAFHAQLTDLQARPTEEVPS